MIVPESWHHIIFDELDKPYFIALTHFVEKEYKQQQCFPPQDKIFHAFKSCSLNDLKVVIIGQDPYHDSGQANGLCFSVNEGIMQPPSLKNIFKELKNDLDIPLSESGNLERWANQGVLLLNATLTVRAHAPGSHHKKGWETFTNKIIKEISNQKNGVVFLLWGNYAKSKIKFIDTTKHHVLESGHPSPLSANRGYWFGNKHFSKTNFLLEQDGQCAVRW
jgi:uracil-DNA glycosylase